MEEQAQRFGAIVRAVTRPTITILFVIALIAGVFEGIEFPQWFLDVSRLCVGWWFVERSVRHVAERRRK